MGLHPLLLHVLALTGPRAGPKDKMPTKPRSAIAAPLLEVRRVAPVAALLGGAAACPGSASAESIADAASDFYQTFFAQPAIVFDRSLTYMDPTTGALTTPISGADFSPSSIVLLLFFVATRGGGIFPDEKPFNLVQRWVRARLRPFGISWFDYAPNDERRQWQDSWYGQDDPPSTQEAPLDAGEDAESIASSQQLEGEPGEDG